MQIYTVHIKQFSDESVKDIQLVPEEKFSWYAAIFQFFWALYHHLWLFAALVFSAGILVSAVERSGYIGFGVSLSLQIGIAIYVGYAAYDWKRKGLERQGYSLCDIVAGRDAEEAMYRFLERHAHQRNKRGEASFPLPEKA